MKQRQGQGALWVAERGRRTGGQGGRRARSAGLACGHVGPTACLGWRFGRGLSANLTNIYMAFYQCWGRKGSRGWDTPERGRETLAGVPTARLERDPLTRGTQREASLRNSRLRGAAGRPEAPGREGGEAGLRVPLVLLSTFSRQSLPSVRRPPASYLDLRGTKYS